jgi:hypothetical protein
MTAAVSSDLAVKMSLYRQSRPLPHADSPVRPQTRQLLENLHDSPAFVLGRYLEAQAERSRRGDIMNLTPGQLDKIGQLSDQWSFLWDKRRSLWIAAEDCPDGEQIEETDLDVLLARLPVIVTPV